MKRTRLIPLTLITLLLGGTFAATAAASAPHASASATAEQAFHIDMATNRALLHVSDTAVAGAAKRARTLLTACLTRDLVQMTDASQTNPNGQKALELISEEAGVEYEMATLQPIMRPLLNGVHRLLTLRLPSALRAQMKGYLEALAKVQSLNACADAQSWLAGGLTPAQEPRGTAQIALTVAAFHKLTAGNAQTQVGDLPAAQVHALKLEKTRAGKHVDQLISRSIGPLEAWTKQLEITVEKESTTTTTTTPPTTTPTTTTGGT